jgi:hypothetical protein
MTARRKPARSKPGPRRKREHPSIELQKAGTILQFRDRRRAVDNRDRFNLIGTPTR